MRISDEERKTILRLRGINSADEGAMARSSKTFIKPLKRNSGVFCVVCLKNDKRVSICVSMWYGCLNQTVYSLNKT